MYNNTKKKKSSIWGKIRSAYLNCIRLYVKYLKRRNVVVFGLVSATFLTEPLNAFKGAFMTPYGWKRHFDYFDLNPKELTSSQLRENPVLLIHGNYDNQRAWLQLAEKLQKEGIPAFTLNLPPGKVSRWDKCLLERKWDEIRNLYHRYGRKDAAINIVGHSRGAYLSVMMGVNKEGWEIRKRGVLSTDLMKRHQRPDIGKIIQIGQYFSLNEFQDEVATALNLKERIFSITGTRDILAPSNSNALPPDHKFTFDEGHLGLIFSDEVDQKIIDIAQISLT